MSDQTTVFKENVDGLYRRIDIEIEEDGSVSLGIIQEDMSTIFMSITVCSGRIKRQDLVEALEQMLREFVSICIVLPVTDHSLDALSAFGDVKRFQPQGAVQLTRFEVEALHAHLMAS